jgi:transcriptional regulator with XRE-family HTH domain
MTDERLMKQVGKRVRQLRLARGLKQEGMCRFGFEYKYYQRIEYGQKNLSLKTLNRLAKAFGVSVAELLRPE